MMVVGMVGEGGHDVYIMDSILEGLAIY